MNDLLEQVTRGQAYDKRLYCPFCNSSKVSLYKPDSYPFDSSYWLWTCQCCKTSAPPKMWNNIPRNPERPGWWRCWVVDVDGFPLAVGIGINIAHGILRANPRARGIRFGDDSLMEACAIYGERRKAGLNNSITHRQAPR